MKRTGLLAPLAGALIAAAAPLMPMPAAASGAVMLEGGVTEDRVDAQRYGGAARWELKPQWFQVGDWHVVSYLEFGINYWDGHGGKTGNDNLVDFSLTPVLRYEQDPKQGIAPFIEVGVGAHVHTKNGIDDKDFDIPFAFGSHLGLGARFGEQGKYELLYRYQHQSNAGIGDKNPGINFHLVSFGIHF